MDQPNNEIHRLATLIVEVLQIGTRSTDRMSANVCDAFGIDLPSLVDAQPNFTDEACSATRTAVLTVLRKAPSPEALAQAFLQEGTDVVAMVDDIYRLLAAHEVTTSQTSESFRLRMSQLDLDITISAEFVERVRLLFRRLSTVDLGVINLKHIRDLVLFDGGESYGSFPTEGPDARPLLHEVMLLGAVEDELRERAARDASFYAAVQACVATRRSTENLLRRLERLVTSYAVGVLDEMVPQTAAPEAQNGGSDERGLAVERQTLLEYGMVGGPVMASLFHELEANEFVGLRAAHGNPFTLMDPPVATRSLALADRYGDTISTLGAYLGIVRGQLTLKRDRWGGHDPARGRALDVVEASTPAPAVSWLAEITKAAEAAIGWIDAEVWTSTGTSRTITTTQEELEDVLNLPLWRQREVLFEIWVLSHTITTCEAQRWKADLRGLNGATWVLPGQGAEQPVATLLRDGLELDVWREAARGTTPDVSLATPGPTVRDLVVIEAKDRAAMPTGIASQSDPGPKTALASGLKYVRALGPTLTWVVNHGAFRGVAADPDRNEGSAWHDLRLAAEVGPGSVPPAFASSLRAALRPPSAQRLPLRPELVLVLDTTGSMVAAAAQIGDLLEGLEPRGWDYSALLVGDHGDAEEYIVRAVASQETPTELRWAVEREPRTHGGDEPEALEDAMRRAAWQAAGDHQVFLVATDAPPHPRSECPQDIDFKEEVEKVLRTGAAVWVVSDFLGSSASVWEPFIDRPRFALVALSDLPSRLAALSGVSDTLHSGD